MDCTLFGSEQQDTNKSNPEQKERVIFLRSTHFYMGNATCENKTREGSPKTQGDPSLKGS
jgi:hypothetical protein